jgi:hypothetical protein
MLPVNASLNASFRLDVLELARFLTELSVIDYFFVTSKTSSVALAALLNAMELLQLGPFIPEFLDQLTLLDGLDSTSEEVKECRIRLEDLYLQGGYAQTSSDLGVQHSDTRTDNVSPVCASAFEQQHQQPRQQAVSCKKSCQRHAS